MQKGAILFVRSIFPIHALGAALQSLGVIRKYILKDESVGVGRIILPALILHGTFDAVLMVLNCLQEETWNYYADDIYITEFTMPLWLSILSWIFVLGVVAGAVMFYNFGNRRQMHFIYQLENDEIEEDNIMGAGSGSYSLQTDDDSYNNHNHNRVQRRRKQEEKYKAPKIV